ncbi:hypothetical protein AVO45_15760 [Ruegeria marisrubri]|uniref:Oligosaccharide repeat unit polymerase n=1 Tax=Ruegeria marisrubri TaxID=1685379 RepID=A0A0X3TBL0_9RHOB|nr:O-antigen polymerase [Ruegeria marisrubri]KUJ73195.1 hypothetical protein AVO45_15760 [Ruegeria marisrubri]
MKWLSPLFLLAVCWGLTFAFAGLALALPKTFDLLPVFLAREGLDPAAFTWLGGLWVMTAMAALLTGNLAARVALPRPRPWRHEFNLPRAARLTAYANTLFLVTTLCWVALTAARNGGLASLVSLAAQDTLGARDLLLQNKLFTGMRLIYAALPATGCLAAGILAAGGRSLPRRARRGCVHVLFLNGIALFLLPVVMSQRLLLLQFVLSAYLVTCLIRRRLVGLRWLMLGVLVFLSVWTLRESLTNPHFDRPAMDIAAQKLAFYFVNDLWNSFAPLMAEAPLTLGAHSLHGLMVLSFTDGIFGPMLANRVDAAQGLRGGGEFSLLTAPYVDFGPFGGATTLVAAGFVLRLAYHRAHGNLLWAALYAQIGAALLFSSHGLYVTHQNSLFSMLVIAALCRLSRMRRTAVALPAQELLAHARSMPDRRRAHA